MMRTKWEPHEVAKSHVSGQDCKTMGDGMRKDRVVRLTTQADIATSSAEMPAALSTWASDRGRSSSIRNRAIYGRARTSSAAIVRAA